MHNRHSLFSCLRPKTHAEKVEDEQIEMQAQRTFPVAQSSSTVFLRNPGAKLLANTVTHSSFILPHSLVLKSQQSEEMLIVLDSKSKPRQ